ncbi:MAG: dihydropyrimidine dehydrogenase [Phyllobacteriaceae bacterium]|nr:dihydropyrimidine dehydrogenase [Phyllobacteriaceae bacterium]MBA91867.1 dihydropyrimidine dehydrogenase [Phyllobacteriaceae bacterium]
MAENSVKEGIAAGRLTPEDYARNFSDLHPPLDGHEARVESDRCYFCHDAPCMNACPTAIDIPMFIRQIQTGNPLGAAKTIFDQNILGGMCARVCPTETLCEEVCVREVAEGKPVRIGELQRYATDTAMREGKQFYRRAPSTGKTVAVIGAGPAGLACAHRLATKGHAVDIIEARDKSGGLNEYGIAAYKATDRFAQAEVDYVTAIGGIAIHHGQMLGRDVHLADLLGRYDAVFLGMGLAGVNALGSGDTDAEGSDDAVDWIAGLRQAEDLGRVPVGRRVVVIGGGMTAIDAAVQAKALGADEVTVAYRGPQSRMKASPFEQELAQTKGVVLRFDMQPKRIVAEGGKVTSIEFERAGETVTIACDQVFKAIGQAFAPSSLNGSSPSITLEGGRIAVDAEGRTSLPSVWAGGDCTNSGDDLTVTAVAQGRDAAESIHNALTA